MTPNQQKLTVICPVSLTESNTGNADRLAWRNGLNEAGHLRLSLMLRSFHQNFVQDDLHEFLILTPPDEVAEVTGILHSCFADQKFKVISESTVCPDIHLLHDPATGKVRGWYAQQFLKIAASRQVSTDHYLTMDSDIVCRRSFGRKHLFHEGKALANVERVTDYHEIYTPEFASYERRTKNRRYRCSADLLGYTGPALRRDTFYGETPVVLRTQSVLDLIEHLEQRHGRSWTEVLASQLGWTEYSLYFQYLEFTRQLNDQHQPATCNTILDLERSVWQSSQNYRKERSYDAAHFGPPHEGGLFVAVQSWLPETSWLPDRFESIAQFYSELDEIV